MYKSRAFKTEPGNKLEKFYACYSHLRLGKHDVILDQTGSSLDWHNPSLMTAHHTHMKTLKDSIYRNVIQTMHAINQYQ